MARFITTIAALLATAALSACDADVSDEAGSGLKAGKAFQLGDFSAVQLAGPFDATITTGGKPAVTIEGPQEIVDRLIVEVKDGELSIRTPRGARLRTNQPVKIRVSAPQLTAATIAGAGDIAIDKLAGGGNFDGTIAGAGSLDLGEVSLGSLKVSIAGSGEVTGSGTAASANHSISGSGSIRLADVATRDVEVSIMGSGDIEVQASQTADVSIMGSGDVRVTGGAKCEVTKMGSGNVDCS